MTIELGDEVKDSITGFKGIAFCRHIYLTGCDRISVQPPMKKDGETPVDQSFDEPMLIVTKSKKIKVSEKTVKKMKDKGGVQKHTDHKKK